MTFPLKSETETPFSKIKLRKSSTEKRFPGVFSPVPFRISERRNKAKTYRERCVALLFSERILMEIRYAQQRGSMFRIKTLRFPGRWKGYSDFNLFGFRTGGTENKRKKRERAVRLTFRRDVIWKNVRRRFRKPSPTTMTGEKLKRFFWLDILRRNLNQRKT